MLVSDVAEMAPIRAIEEEIAKSFGHSQPCFETWADIKAEELGTDGNYDDVMDDGRTFIDHYRSELAAKPKLCTCEVYEVAGPNPFAEDDDLAADRAWDLEHGQA